MGYLDIIKKLEAAEPAAAPDSERTLHDEIDERNERSPRVSRGNSSTSSISFADALPTPQVETLRLWLEAGTLHSLPDPLPGFTDELAQYADRARLIGMVRAILNAVPWSLTGQERAVQFVAMLAPLIEQRAGDERTEA